MPFIISYVNFRCFLIVNNSYNLTKRFSCRFFMSTYSFYLLYGVLHISYNGYGELTMKLNDDHKSKDPTYFIQVGIRNGIKVTIENFTRIGKHSELWKITDDLLAYAKQKVK